MFLPMRPVLNVDVHHFGRPTKETCSSGKSHPVISVVGVVPFQTAVHRPPRRRVERVDS